MGYSDRDAMRDNIRENDLDRRHDVYMANLNNDIWKEQFLKQSYEYTNQLQQSQDAGYQQWLRTQSPEALMQHAAAAGINPAAFYSQINPSGAPSPSISVPSPSGGHSGSYGSGRGFSQPVPEVLQISQAMQALSNMGQQGAQAADTIGQLNANIRSKVSDANLKDMQASYQGMYNAAYSALGDDKKMAVFMKDFNQGLLYREQGDLVESQKYLNRAMEYYYNNLGHKTSAEGLMVFPYMQALIKNLDSSSELNTQQAKTQPSVRAVNFAQSDYYKSLKLTEDALRSNRVEALDLSNDLATLSKFVAGNELKYSDAILNKRIEMYAQQLEHAGIINQQEWQNLKIITTQADWAERQEFKNYITGFLDSANGAINNVVGSQSNILNRLSAQERNQIHEKFVDNMRTKGFNTGTPYAPPTYHYHVNWE